MNEGEEAIGAGMQMGIAAAAPILLQVEVGREVLKRYFGLVEDAGKAQLDPEALAALAHRAKAEADVAMMLLSGRCACSQCNGGQS